MGPVIVKGISIGSGRPKICVPLVGETKAEIIDEARLVASLAPDLVELRIDFFKDVHDPAKVLDTLREARNALGELPLLFTFRTRREGGKTSIDDAYYAELNGIACKSALIDLIDVELNTPRSIRDAVIAMAREKGVFVVVSNHDFEKTPNVDELVDRLVAASRIGDIAKIAVMPLSPEDVVSLLAATVAAKRQIGDAPIITISMGAFGVVSRLTGEAFGSAVTFGSAKAASAPGQIPVATLRTVLNVVHESLH
ncbi:MAG: type I 3-dehydroquinate dehydratase [Treponemataceae bacterium]